MKKGANILPFVAIGGILLLMGNSGKAADKVNSDLNNLVPGGSGPGSYPNHDSTVRGLRNNNPGNLVSSKFIRSGEILPSGDNVFKQFKTMAEGYAGMFTQLLADNQEGQKTITSIMTKWAPPPNDTINYILYVSDKTGIPADQTVDFGFPDDMVSIVKAISQKENGQPANDTQVMDGYDLFISENPTV